MRLPFSKLSGVFVWIGVIVLFGLWIPDTFLTKTTFQQIAGTQAITAIIAMGVLFVLSAGEFDLSFAQNVGLSAVIAAWLMVTHHVPWPLASAITLVVGIAIGAINGALVAGIGVPSFVATLGVSSVLLAMTELVSGDTYIGPVPGSFQGLTNHQPLGIPLVFLYAIVVAALAWYALEHTPFGRRMQATGANADAARLSGVRTKSFVVGSFLLSGVLGSLGGLLVASRTGTVSPQLGPPYLLPAFAACFLGATQIKPGRFNVWGTILALYLLETGVQGLQLAGAALWVTDLFNGVALVGAVTVAVLLQKGRSARSRVIADASGVTPGADASRSGPIEEKAEA